MKKLTRRSWLDGKLDPALPGLVDALDGTRMLAWLRAHLEPYACDKVTIEVCEVTRIRYRESTRAVVQYGLDCRLKGADRAQRVIVTGTLYGDKSAVRIVRRMRNGYTLPRGVTPLFKPIASVPGLNMLLQVFPADRRLPALASIAAGLPASCSETIARRLGLTESQRAASRTCPVRYRAGLSAVCRHEFFAADGTLSATVFSKTYRDCNDAQQAFSQLTKLASNEEMPVRVGLPVVFLDDYQTLVIREASGRTLEDVVLSGKGDAQIEDVAARLARLHLCGTVDVRRQHTAADQRRVLKRGARRLSWALPELEQRIQQVMAYAAQINGGPRGVTHRDLKVDHIFIDDADVTLIDWDSCAMADPVIDAAMLVSRLSALSICNHLPSSYVDQVKEQFKKAYFACVPSSWQQRFARHYAGALLDVAVGFVGRQEPNWQHVVTSLLLQAEAVAGQDRTALTA